ncbi:MAG: hypothetical protein ACC651_15570 [Candidatus Scalindua sp.]
MKKIIYIYFICSFALLVAGCSTPSSRDKNISIVTSKSVMDDAGYALAIKDLTSALKSFDYVVKIVYSSKIEDPDIGNKIVLGSANEALGESYKIKEEKISGGNSLKIEGGERGLMYGIFKLAEEVRLEKKLWDIDIEKSPEFSRRMYTELGQLLDLPSIGYHLFKPPWVNHKKLEAEVNELKLLVDHIAKMGFNTFTVLHVNFEDYINYKYLDKEVYQKNDVHRIKSKLFAQHMTDLVNYAHKRHIEVFLQVYELQYPPRLAELYNLDLEDPDMEKIVSSKMKELFEVIPLDGVVITATESNPRSGYLSKNPWKKYGKVGAGKMMTMYHNAAKAVGKTSIFRSWLVAIGATDSHIVMENTPVDTQLEIKHTGRDFFINFPLTDEIAAGIGKIRPVTITFDVFPEYYGWSRLICYQNRIAKEARIAKKNQVKGIQAWGSWSAGCIWSDQHPGYLPNGQLKVSGKKIMDWASLWDDFRIFTNGFTPGQMNAYQVSRIMWDINLSAEEIAFDWGKINFGTDNAKAVSEVLMNSQAAFRELYPPGKFKMSYSPVYLKWASMLMLDQTRIAEVYTDDVSLEGLLERNKIGYKILKKMRDAISKIDVKKVPSKETYKIFVEGFDKTELYISMFFEYRELWMRKRDLKNDNLGPQNMQAFAASQDRFDDILEKWKKYPEETKYWGISKKVFDFAEEKKGVPYTLFVTREFGKDPAYYIENLK